MENHLDKSLATGVPPKACLSRMEPMKKKDDKRKEAGVYENNENVKIWATIAIRMTDEKAIENLERVYSCMIVKRSDIRREVKDRSFEDKRKRRFIVFNLRYSEVKNDRELRMGYDLKDGCENTVRRCARYN